MKARAPWLWMWPKRGDTKEIPPCLIRKSDGASLYATSDLATIVEREQDF